jgi:subtilisin family serine protease
MTPLELVGLPLLMSRTRGRSELIIGLIDGPVVLDHPQLASENIRKVPGDRAGDCTQPSNVACLHGTFIAGILSGKRHSFAPAICPDCTLLIRPIFAEGGKNEQLPRAAPKALADAIVECVEAGARCINLSLALERPSPAAERDLDDALDHAFKREVIVVAAAGNQRSLGSSALTRHATVIPVVACDLQGRPTNDSNLGRSIGLRGLTAPGGAITSLGPDDKPVTLGGTSVATPFVTGAIALLWSEFRKATAAQIKAAVTNAHGPRRTRVVPPLLNASAAYQFMAAG